MSEGCWGGMRLMAFINPTIHPFGRFETFGNK